MSSVAKIHELFRAAEAAGVAKALVSAARSEAINLMLNEDPRKAETASLARQVAAADRRMRAAGTADRMSKLMQQFDFSRSRIYQLLELSNEPLDNFVVTSGP
jgi:hypothetical protein